MRCTIAVTFLALGCRPSSPIHSIDPTPLLDIPSGKTDLVDYEPAWSPDGSQLAFISNRDGPLKVYKVGVDGTGLTRLTDGPAEDDSPAWSPDGTRIAFVSTRDGNSEIYVMGADGSNQTRLTNDSAIDIHPTWRPDGKSLIWNSSRATANPPAPEIFAVYAMDLDGSGAQRLTQGGTATYASWSPDGTRLLYRREVTDSNSDIVVQRSDHSELYLTHDPAFDGWPAWSNDGQRVIFARERGKDASIFMVNADGSGLTPTVTMPGRWTNPRWNPRDDRVVVSHRTEGALRLYLFRAQPATGRSPP